MSHQKIDPKTSAGTMAGNDDGNDWVYLDGDQETKASAMLARAVVCGFAGLDESVDSELLVGLDYLMKKKTSQLWMDFSAPAPDDATEVVATVDVVGDGAVDDVNFVEDEDNCSDHSNEGRPEKAYESDQDLDHVVNESQHEQHGTSDLRLKGLLDNLKSIERRLLDCQRELLDCQKSIKDLRKATRDETAPAPAPAPSTHLYNAHHEAAIAEAYASSYRGVVYSGKSSGYGYHGGGYGTSSSYIGNDYGGRGYYGGLSDYDYGGGRGGYYRGMSDYDYDGLGYYYFPGISDCKYGYGDGGGYGIGSGYRYGGGEGYGGISDYGYRYGDRGGYYIGSSYRYGGGGGYGGISDYGYRYGRVGGHYSDFDYGGHGDRHSGSSDNSYGYRPDTADLYTRNTL